VITVPSYKILSTNGEAELKKLNFGGCIAKIETLGVELKVNSNIGG
jgi:hypothetical protein